MVQAIPMGVLGSVLAWGMAAGFQVPPKVQSYGVGERIDADVWVSTRDLEPVRISDLIKQETKVVVLILFGGARNVPNSASRSPLWCEDSFDDLALQRALIQHFKKRPVQFLAVAVPPVYDAKRFGFSQGSFLLEEDSSVGFRAQSRAFVRATQRQLRNQLLPYPQLFFDLRFRLGLDLERHHPKPSYGQVPSWIGKFRVSSDSRKYGVPTLWLLDRSGRVLRAPFFGNIYESDPPEIEYEFSDVKQAIETHLASPLS